MYMQLTYCYRRLHKKLELGIVQYIETKKNIYNKYNIERKKYTIYTIFLKIFDTIIYNN